MKDLYRAGVLVTSNAKNDVYFDAFMLVEKGKIIDLGPWARRPRSRSFKIHDYSFGMITPGLFNLHTHLAMTLFRGMIEDVDFQTWLFQYVIPTEAKWVSTEMVKVGAELGLCESIKNGITYIADMYYFEEEVGKAIDRMHLRGMLGYHVWDNKTPDHPNPDSAMNAIRKLARTYKEHPRIQLAVAPHAPYTCSFKVLQECSALARELHLPMMTHLSETQKEFTDLLKTKECTPVEYMDDAGCFDVSRILLAHSIWMAEHDYALLKRDSVSVVLNPQCNAKIASGFVPVGQYHKRGIRFTFGTDGAASNNNLDIFAEMNFLSKMYHLHDQDLAGLPGTDVFAAATRKAAEAVGLGERLGSLEPQKEADFIVIDTRAPHLTPLTRPYSHLIYSVRGSDVHSTFVGGKPLMLNRKILVADENRIRDKANAFWKKIQRA